MLDYDATLSLSRIWPPDKLILKSRTSGNREAPFEAWYPVSPDAHLLLLRDTDEVSPVYYDYLLKTILSHRYSGSESRMASVLGVTLRSARDDQGKIRSGNGDVGTPTLLFPNHFTAFHRTLRQADTSVGPGADQVGAWRRYVREHQLVVITPAAIEHEDDTFVFVKDFTGDRTITVDEAIKNTGPRLLDDPGWWRSIGPDQFVDGVV
ncbi:protein of unknown function [Taphrina deformans PYCC 5710]|uniref:Uncharacterized protein n=1 Tax=Taphrina deformans (strain PYCC 5710 / ATCC 11124 / CBS 356.35 / IMI 108563 / JCM 9778 / NBRC 8474) TaxID=1097556 RepID=R4XDW5_TAPDE|nr:protein of unknown function [Taphrina deformans PYCC 5710]|eukprot:CCG81529.1 protein of unknown function [Taphrina deformans PYCC 5710]